MFSPKTTSVAVEKEVFEPKFKNLPVIRNKTLSPSEIKVVLCKEALTPSEAGCADCVNKENCIAYAAFKRKEG